MRKLLIISALLFCGTCFALEDGQRPELSGGASPSTAFSYKAQRQRAYRQLQENEQKLSRSLSYTTIQRSPYSRNARRQAIHQQFIEESTADRAEKEAHMAEQYAESRARREADQAAGYRRQYNLRVVGDDRYERFDTKFRTLDEPQAKVNAEEKFYAQKEDIPAQETIVDMPTEEIPEVIDPEILPEPEEDNVDVDTYSEESENENTDALSDSVSADHLSDKFLKDLLQNKLYREKYEELFAEYQNEMKALMDAYEIKLQRYQRELYELEQGW